MDQISFFIALYIAKWKFLPALKSRNQSAWHTLHKYEYFKQLRFALLYKYLIIFIMATFEMVILRDLIFYNGYVIFESISSNSCWFSVAYHFPVFKLSAPIVSILVYSSLCFLIVVRFFDIILPDERQYFLCCFMADFKEAVYSERYCLSCSLGF